MSMMSYLVHAALGANVTRQQLSTKTSAFHKETRPALPPEEYRACVRRQSDVGCYGPRCGCNVHSAVMVHHIASESKERTRLSANREFGQFFIFGTPRFTLL
jgi:hypothetical protein